MRSEAAYYDLIDALASGFRALRDPACTRLLGPVVPGATMAFGARVPGTSYVLDPVQAAFNLGVMIGWPGGAGADDTACPGSHARPAQTLAGVLVVADFLARQALAEARAPLTLQDVLDRLDQARAIQQRLASATAGTGATGDHAMPVRVATAAVVAAMIGGTHEQVSLAATCAWMEGDARAAGVPAEVISAREAWLLADAASRGVRLAWLALAAEPRAAVAWPPAIGSVLEAFGGHQAGEPPVAAAVAARIRERFEASVVQHFSAAQAARIRTLYGAADALAAIPCNECVSVLVRN
jgi:2-methylcitrate dehydratase